MASHWYIYFTVENNDIAYLRDTFELQPVNTTITLLIELIFYSASSLHSFSSESCSICRSIIPFPRTRLLFFLIDISILWCNSYAHRYVVSIKRQSPERAWNLFITLMLHVAAQQDDRKRHADPFNCSSNDRLPIIPYYHSIFLTSCTRGITVLLFHESVATSCNVHREWATVFLVDFVSSDLISSPWHGNVLRRCSVSYCADRRNYW